MRAFVSYLPLGMRVLNKVQRIVREEMDRAGAQEIVMPILQPAELWKTSGRWETMGPGLFHLKDRGAHEYALSPTAEEVVTDLAKNIVSSYRQLPATLYQIQWKFRDEIRPRFGLMRSKGEKPLPPAVSLASQSHHEKPPEVTCTSRGNQGFLPQPGKDLERPSSTRLEARFPYQDSRAMTRSPSPLAWRPDFPGAPREAH